MQLSRVISKTLESRNAENDKFKGDPGENIPNKCFSKKLAQLY